MAKGKVCTECLGEGSLLIPAETEEESDVVDIECPECSGSGWLGGAAAKQPVGAVHEY